MQILLAIEVFVSFLLIFTLLLLVLRRREQLFSRTAFERFKEARRAKRGLTILFFLVLGSFILHELIEILLETSTLSPKMMALLHLRHSFIYLFLISFQGFGVYLALRLIRETK